MNRNDLKRLLRAGGVAIGSWVTLADPAVVELAALAGYDYCGIMMEHSSPDFPTL